jgi:hypothetical protein
MLCLFHYNKYMPKMNITKIYVFGNKLLAEDSLPFRLLPWLKRRFSLIQFRVFDPNENLILDNKEIIIIDSAEGIERVEIIHDIDQLGVQKIYSLHDFDLALNLKLLKKIGKLEKVTIFAIPCGMDIEIAKKQLINIFNLVVIARRRS